MAEHFAYWERFEQRGQVVVLGPVLDPAGTWGLGIIEGETDDAVRAIALEDPAVKSGMSTFEVLAMADPFVARSGQRHHPASSVPNHDSRTASKPSAPSCPGIGCENSHT